MKKSISLIKLILLLIFSNWYSANAQIPDNDGRFTLKGKVTGRDTGRIVLFYTDKNRKQVADTAWLKQGAFGFKGYIDGTTYAKLVGDIKSWSINDPNQTELFIEPASMSAALTENDFKHARITGSLAQLGLDTINSQTGPIYEALKPLDIEYTRLKTAYAKGNRSQAMHDSLAAMQVKIKPFLSKRDEVFYNYVFRHPNNYLSAGLIVNFIVLSKLDRDSIAMLYSALTQRVRSSELGILAYHSVQAFLPNNNGTIGNIVPDFTKNDMDNKTLNLYTFKGKNYVLLDFWATWCGPCKRLIPHLQDIYRQYHSKGLEIISISWDYNMKDWKAGVMKMNMNAWYNRYADFRTVDDDLTHQFGIEMIPTVVLIDKNGKIAARYTGTDDNGDINELHEKLSELIK